MRQPVRELAVVRQHERARRVDVETPHRHHPRLGRHEVDDGPPSVRIARCRDDARRLVQEDVRERLTLDADAVDLDEVALADDGVQLARLAVHAHAPLADQDVGSPPRGDTGAREESVEAHERISPG